MKYTASIDGIRALSILGVLAFHASSELLPGGYTGVDIFFVTSGYLITSLALDALDDGSFSIREFYVRRIFRILPNALLVIFLTIVLARVLLPLPYAADIARHSIWGLLNASNIYICRNVGSYWGNLASSMPLLHTWSLAAEEQFYLFYPVLLVAIPKKRRLAILCLLVCITFTSFAIGLRVAHDTAFYVLRAWQPLVGCLLAVQLRATSVTRSSASVIGIVGLVLVGLSYSGIDATMRTYALAPTLGAVALLIATKRDDCLIAKLLSKKPMAWIGKLSYSLYLWHWPLLVLGVVYAEAYGFDVRWGKAIGLAIALFSAPAAYYLVELPARYRLPRRTRFIVIGTALTTCLVLAWQTVSASPPPLVGFDKPTHPLYLYSAGANADVEAAIHAPRLRGVSLPGVDAGRSVNSWKDGGLVHRWGVTDPEVVLLGSSHALMYAQLIDTICRDLHVSVAFLAVDGVSVFFRGGVEGFDESRTHWLQTWKPKVVIAIDVWEAYGRSNLTRNIEGLVDHLHQSSPAVILLTQPPIMMVGEEINAREYVAWWQNRTGTLPDIRPDRSEDERRLSNAIVESVSRTKKGVLLVRAHRYFYQPNGSVRWHDGRKLLYADDDHLSADGAELVREELRDRIKQALNVDAPCAAPESQHVAHSPALPDG